MASNPRDDSVLGEGTTSRREFLVRAGTVGRRAVGTGRDRPRTAVTRRCPASRDARRQGRDRHRGRGCRRYRFRPGAHLPGAWPRDRTAGAVRWPVLVPERQRQQAVCESARDRAPEVDLRRPRLHDASAQGRQVPRRHAVQRRGGRLQLHALSRPALTRTTTSTPEPTSRRRSSSVSPRSRLSATTRSGSRRIRTSETSSRRSCPSTAAGS